MTNFCVPFPVSTTASTRSPFMAGRVQRRHGHPLHRRRSPDPPLACPPHAHLRVRVQARSPSPKSNLNLSSPLPASLAERYTLERQLAMGGSAEVWQGVDRVLDRPVAVKVLHRHLLTDETTRARLTQEARAAAALSDPGIVAIYDVAVDSDAAAIILELIGAANPSPNGCSAKRTRPPRAAARIGAEVAEALDHAHQRGVTTAREGRQRPDRDGRRGQAGGFAYRPHPGRRGQPPDG